MQKSSSKSITIDLQKEYEEDKEIIDLLEGKRNQIYLYYFYNIKNIAYTSHNPCRKNILIEIAEKEEEEDSTARNESKIKYKKNDIKNQSGILFDQNKKLMLKRNKKNENESKNNDDYDNNDIKNVLNNKNKNEINENRKDENIFNNYIVFRSSNSLKKNKLNTINYIGSRNADNVLNSLKANFSCHKKSSPFNFINRYEKVNLKEENLKNKILNDNINNDNNLKVSLPNLNIGLNDNRRSLSSNNNYTKIKIAKSQSLTNNHNSLGNSHKNYNDPNNNIEKEDNYKIDLLSTNSKSSNILIPIITSQNKINTEKNNEKKDGNSFKYINQNQTNIKKSSLVSNNTKENNKNNNLNEIIKSNNNKNTSKLENKRIFLDNNYNFLMSIDHSFMAKLHKIKIEKGMMGNKFFERINKNLLNNEYNHLATFENYTTNSKLPLISKTNNRNSHSKIRINNKRKVI